MISSRVIDYFNSNSARAVAGVPLLDILVLNTRVIDCGFASGGATLKRWVERKTDFIPWRNIARGISQLTNSTAFHVSEVTDVVRWTVPSKAAQHGTAIFRQWGVFGK